MVFGASTPWKRITCSLGLGTSAASRCINSSGGVPWCVVPSRQGVLSFRTTWPAALHCARSSVLRWAGDVAAQLFQRLAVVGATAHRGVQAGRRVVQARCGRPSPDTKSPVDCLCLARGLATRPGAACKAKPAPAAA